MINHPNDICVLCLLEYTQNKSYREKRIYKSLLQKYGHYQYDFQLEQKLFSKGYIYKEIPNNPLEDEPDISPVTTQIGRNAIKYAVFKSETGICFDSIWLSIVRKILNKVIDYSKILLL